MMPSCNFTMAASANGFGRIDRNPQLEIALGAATKLVQILLPAAENLEGEDLQGVFERLANELTDRFGGVTSYIRAPAEGRWRNGLHDTERDEITVVEVMVEAIDRAYWADLRLRLEQELSQAEIVIRCQSLELL